MESRDLNYKDYLNKTKNGQRAILNPKYPRYNGDEPCAEFDLDTFYVEDRTHDEKIQTAIAKQACSRCPLIVECFQWALGREFYGIWGGTTAKEREAIRKKYLITVATPEYADKYLKFQEDLRDDLIKDLEVGEYGEEEIRVAKRK